MRDDLLDAQAAVDWAVSQNHVLHQRVMAFINGKPYAVVQEVDPHSRQKVTKIAKVTPIPRVIKAETGAIVHSIRSSLDLLATVLAERNGATVWQASAELRARHSRSSASTYRE